MNFHFLNGRNNTANIQQGTLLTRIHCDQNESQRRNLKTTDHKLSLQKTPSTNFTKSPQTNIKQMEKKNRNPQRKQQRMIENIHKLLATYLCLRGIYGLSPAEQLYSNAVSQPKHHGRHFHPASPQPASDNIKIHEKKTLKSLPHRRDFRDNREHSTLAFTERKSPTPS